LKVVYFGTAEFAVPALKKVADHVVLVVTQPDRPSGRGLKVHSSPVKQAAIELGLPIVSPESARNQEFIDSIEEIYPDILLVAAYGQILSLKLLKSAKFGGINLHGSILPAWRGAAPIQRSIMSGDQETGVTLMQMAKGMDTGDIIEIRKIEIGINEKADNLTKRLAELGAELALDWLPALTSGEYLRIPQDHDSATMAPKITREETLIKASNTAIEAFNLFRGVFPSPGAYFETISGEVKATEIEVGNAELGALGEPGTVVKLENNFYLSLAEGSLRLLKIKPNGKPEMKFSDYANGIRLKSGDAWLR